MQFEEDSNWDEEPTRDRTLKKLATWLGVPLGLAVSALSADYGVDKMQQELLVRDTREKAQLVATSPVKGVMERKAYLENNKPCAVRSISHRGLFEMSADREIEYKCGDAKVLCAEDKQADDYECERLNFQKGALRQLRASHFSKK